MFHVDLPIDTQFASILSSITVSLLFIHKTIRCVHQHYHEREQGIQLPVSHTLTDHHICHGAIGRLGAMSRMKVFLRQA